MRPDFGSPYPAFDCAKLRPQRSCPEGEEDDFLAPWLHIDAAVRYTLPKMHRRAVMRALPRLLLFAVCLYSNRLSQGTNR